MGVARGAHGPTSILITHTPKGSFTPRTRRAGPVWPLDGPRQRGDGPLHRWAAHENAPGGDHVVVSEEWPPLDGIAGRRPHARMHAHSRCALLAPARSPHPRSSTAIQKRTSMSSGRTMLPIGACGGAGAHGWPCLRLRGGSPPQDGLSTRRPQRSRDFVMFCDRLFLRNSIQSRAQASVVPWKSSF